MRNPGGVLIGFGDAGVVEVDTFTCGHCQYVTQVPVRADPASLGGHCRSCDKLICTRCANVMSAGGNCVPWEKQMIAMENREAARRSYGL